MEKTLDKNAVINTEQFLEATLLRCTATYHPSGKLSKLDEPDMRDTDGEVGTNS